MYALEHVHFKGMEVPGQFHLPRKNKAIPPNVAKFIAERLRLVWVHLTSPHPEKFISPNCFASPPPDRCVPDPQPSPLSQAHTSLLTNPNARPARARVLVSGFGNQMEVSGARFFVMRRLFHNAPAHYEQKLAHYEKTSPHPQKCYEMCRRTTKKVAHYEKTGTRNLHLVPET